VQAGQRLDVHHSAAANCSRGNGGFQSVERRRRMRRWLCVKRRALWQCLQWLKDGHWYPVPVLAAFDYFRIPYPQTHSEFIISFLDLPLSFTAFIICLYFMAIIFAVLDTQERAARLN
jgi:hypothetical protein